MFDPIYVVYRRKTTTNKFKAFPIQLRQNYLYESTLLDQEIIQGKADYLLSASESYWLLPIPENNY